MRHHVVTTNGIQLAVADLGQGPAVLFCHGFPAIGISWRAQMGAVAAAAYRALAPDMRGYGGSDAPEPPEAYMPFQPVGDLVGLPDHFDLPDCVIVGHDFGANIAWNAALMRPDRFRAVFGVSVPFQRFGGPSFLGRLRAAAVTTSTCSRRCGRWPTRPSQTPRSPSQASTIAPRGGTGGRALGPVRCRSNASRRARTSNRDRSRLYRCSGPLFEERGFHGPLNYYRVIDPFFAIASGAFAGAVIHQPSSFLTGALDGLRPFHPNEAKMRGSLLDLRGVSVLEKIRHWPQLEATADVNRALLDFLAQIGG